MDKPTEYIKRMIKPAACPVYGKEPCIAQEMWNRWHCYCLYWEAGKLGSWEAGKRIDHVIIYAKTRLGAILRWN